MKTDAGSNLQTEAFGGGKECSNAPTTPLFQEAGGDGGGG